MTNIDRQRIAAVRTLEGLGYAFDGVTWKPPMAEPLWNEADELYALLTERADRLGNGSVFSGIHDAKKYRIIVKALEAYEAKRWPDGKEPGGKG
jgi:hypothetical protein